MIRLNFLPFPVLETERTVLREMRHENAEAYLVIRSSDEVNEYILGPRPQTVQDTIAIIDHMVQYAAHNKSVAWTIADKGTGLLAGTICIWNMEGRDDTWELGYSMLPQHWGKDLMAEALNAAVRYGFEQMNLPVISAHTHKDNERSTRLLERSGFGRNAGAEAHITDPAEVGVMVVYSLPKP